MKKLYIEYHPKRSRVALLQDGELVEFHVEKDIQAKLVGNMYKGKVVNVLKGMKAVFVNIGLEKNAFLYIGETLVDKSKLDSSIDYVSKEIKVSAGDEILCQVVKDQFGSKGARISMEISIAGRLLVYMPKSTYIGISHKIDDEIEKERLQRVVGDITSEYSGGFIIRTAAYCATKEQLALEADRLVDEWVKVEKQYKVAPCSSAVYLEGNLVYRSIRDMIDNDLDQIIVNDTVLLNALVDKIQLITPKKDMLEAYKGTEDFFSYFGISKQIEKILKRKVVLKNGAYLIIDRTEALTVIDVNTGKYVGENDLEETVFNTNLIAAEEVAKQLRLRNIGGIIIVDFIDMYKESNRQALMDKLKLSIKMDRVKTTVVSMTHLGLVELTRKKTRSMIDSIMLRPCPYCDGDSFVYSEDYVIMRLREALCNIINDKDPSSIIISIHPDVFAKLVSVRYFERECALVWKNKRIYIVSDESLHVSRYKLTPINALVLDLPNSAKLLY